MIGISRQPVYDACRTVRSEPENMMAKPIPANRIIFTAPPSLLEAVDHAAHSLSLSRSALIRLALERFLAEQQWSLIRASLIEAYQAYAHSSIAITEEFFTAEQEAWDQYAPFVAN